MSNESNQNAQPPDSHDIHKRLTDVEAGLKIANKDIDKINTDIKDIKDDYKRLEDKYDDKFEKMQDSVFELVTAIREHMVKQDISISKQDVTNEYFKEFIQESKENRKETNNKINELSKIDNTQDINFQRDKFLSLDQKVWWFLGILGALLVAYLSSKYFGG